jgi:hypothetical protein
MAILMAATMVTGIVIIVVIEIVIIVVQGVAPAIGDEVNNFLCCGI